METLGPKKRKMPVKNFVILMNSPTRNAKVERFLQHSRATLIEALEHFAGGGELPKDKVSDLIKLLDTAFNLSRTKGAYEGLCRGRRLIEFESRIDSVPARKYLANRIEKYPEATGKGKSLDLCKYMDKQIMRLRTLGTYPKDIPYPSENWKLERRKQTYGWWVEAIDKKPSAVKKFITDTRKLVASDDYTFLLAWRKFEQPKPASDRPQKKVRHRDLGLDKLYDN